MFLNREDIEYSCLGAIIDVNWVVTVDKYCADRTDRVRAGTNSSNEGGTVHRVDKIVRHPGQNVALVHVEEPFEYDDTCQSIPLFDRWLELVPGTMASVTGFKWLSNDKSSGNLQWVELPIAHASACDPENQDVDFHYYPKIESPLGEGLKCLGYVEERYEGVGWDDWGAPVVVNGELVGIAYVLPLLGQRVSYPSLFIDLSFYSDWINEKIKKEWPPVIIH